MRRDPPASRQPSSRRLRRRPEVAVSAGLLVGALAGCPTNLLGIGSEEPPPPPTILPGDCGDVGTAPVNILPRASNEEIKQLTSDLLGAPVDPALFVRWTPLAQVRGFDTQTESRVDSQTLEEQMKTMEAVADQLVRSPSVMAVCPTVDAAPPVCTVHDVYDADAQFSGEQGRDCWNYLDANGALLSFDAGNQRWIASDPGLFLWNNGLHPGINVDVVRRWTAPQDGNAHFTGTVSDTDPGGGDGISFEIRGPAGTAYQTVIVNGGAAEGFDVTLNVRRGETVDLIVRRGGSNAYDSTGLSTQIAFSPAASSAGLTWENCGALVVQQIGSRAYRRPLHSDEVADLQQVFDTVLTSATSSASASPFSEALSTTLQAALLSPQVHYKPEFVPGGFSAEEASFRRASRLALYFRSSFADDELWTLAEQGALLDDEVLRAQAERLLAVDGDRFAHNFGGQWLDFRDGQGGETALQVSMRQESHDVFAALLAEQAGPSKLIAPGFTIADAALATHYGLPPGEGEGPSRIATDARGGVFTQGHFLTKSSTGSDFKRVIHRGVYALNRTLCLSVPMLDQASREEIAESFGGIDQSLPLQQRMQTHRETSNRCKACHNMMDPLGLALEQYDNNGQFRTTYEDGSVISNDFEFNGNPMENAAALEAFISTSESYQLCVAEKLFTYGLHRSLREEEECVLNDVVTGADGAGERSLHDLAVDAFLASLRLTETP